MKTKITYQLLLFCLSVLMAGNINAQDQRTKETKIADIVMQLPAKNTASYNQLMGSLSQLENVIPDLANKLVAPGQGDDSQIRYAIGGLTFYTAKANQTAAVKQVASGLCQAINKAKSDEIKDFLMIQLQYVAGDESIETIKPYLNNDRLCDPAVRILARINNENANQAMLNALKNATGSKQLSLVEGLGYTKYKPALDAITSVAASSDLKLQKTALYALANIASPNSAGLLAKTAEKTGYTFDQTDALQSYLRYLKNMIASGQQATVAKASAEIMKKTSTPVQTAAKSAGLELYSLAVGDKAISNITDALKDKDKKYREAALLTSNIIQSPKMDEALINKAKGASSEVKAEIIQALGVKGSKSALPFIMESLKSKDANVVAASITAAGKLGQEAAIAPIIKAMNAGDETVAKAGKDALLSINSTNIAAEAATAIPQVSPTAKIALIDVLSQKQATQFSKVIFTYSVAEDKQVRNAAYKALKNVVTKNDLNTLASQMSFPPARIDVEALQDALYAAVKDAGTQEQQSGLLLNLMNKADNKKLYFRPLAMVGGENALKVVSEGFNNSDAETRSAAFSAMTEWNGIESASKLFNIAESDPSGSYFDKALMSYVAKISQSKNTGAQKFLSLRKALEIAKTPDQKKEILNQIAQTGTFTALMTAGSYMDDWNQDVQQAAIQTVKTIALAHSEYYGETVTNLLNKAMQLNKNPEAEYQKQAIMKHLAALPKDKGFVSLFNGKDLSGWKGLVENPIARAKMKPAQLQEKQKKANDIMRRDWSVEKGLLVFEGKGYDNLCSEKPYGDIEMYVEWRIAPKGDAGIYLRGTPQVQIWDTALTEVGAQVGSGGLYNNQTNRSTPLVVADNPVNEWNSFYILMIGEKVTVYLNGQLVTDNTTLENYWDRKQGIFPTGEIELQAHGTRVEYRDIYVREIPRPEPYTVSEKEKKEGFVPMFNGVDMSGWTGNLKDYVAQDRTILCNPVNGGHGNLYTEKEYSNFVMRFDFMLTPGANNGLGIRTPMEGDAAYVGMELQILDSEADIYKDLKEYQYHGSVYGVIPAKRGYLKPVGEWNTQEVIAEGNHIKITLNGTVILDGNISDASKQFTATLDGKSHPGLSNAKGHIGFLGHGSEVAFKNLRIKDLSVK